MGCKTKTVHELTFEGSFEKYRAKYLLEDLSGIVISFRGKGITEEQNKQDVLRQLELVFSNEAYILGKSSIVINSEVFGPVLENRDVKTLPISAENTDMKDMFRVAGRRYWTAENGGSSLVYVNSPSGVSFVIEDYDMTKEEATKIMDIPVPPGGSGGGSSTVPGGGGVSPYAPGTDHGEFLGSTTPVTVKVNAPASDTPGWTPNPYNGPKSQAELNAEGESATQLSVTNFFRASR